ncbi:MAG: ChbG/HpnK family deacetylase [Ignavibacteriales bacterium]|nr:ChbG/HpnK family deacetylase [Ignavibacteriales bacterium]
MRKPVLLSSLLLLIVVHASLSAPAGSDSTVTTALIRCDDIGMCHAVNMAAKQVLDQGFPVSMSVMFVCPWYQEAVDLLKQYRNVSVGVHLTLNAEWKNYRWGPVSGRSAVPSLVDSLGFFFPSRATFFAHQPTLSDIEQELRAQLDRALRCGLHIDYVDYHMGTAVDKPESRAILENLAKEYGVAISRYFGEEDVSGVYSAPPAGKLDTLLDRTRKLPSGKINLMVFHVGLEGPEMDALLDLNVFGPADMSKHREGELRALTAVDFMKLIRTMKVHLTTYHELVEEVGLQGMKRPSAKD